MSQNGLIHKSVLLNEAVDFLITDEDGVYLDATSGPGGHSGALADRISRRGRIISMDWDPEMTALAEKNLSKHGEKVKILKGNFAEINTILGHEGISCLSGALFDLGISSLHFDRPERGFSLKHNGPLDMRINPANSLTAEIILNKWPFEHIKHLLSAWGEEKHCHKIAKSIVDRRRGAPLKTTKDLRDIIEKLFPFGMPGKKCIHPATRTFMALRIAVNSELENLARGIEKTSSLIKKGGRIAIISFHSLEDRIVKHTFRSMIDLGGWKWITPKPVRPSKIETDENPRARSAKMRVVEKTG